MGEVCSRELLVASPDETIAEASRKMDDRDIGRLPLLPSGDPRRLNGMLRRSDMLRAHNILLARRAALCHRKYQVRRGGYGGMNTEELVIELDAPCATHPAREVDWPHYRGLASVRRGRQVLIPHRDTELSAGDGLVALAFGEGGQELRRMSLDAPLPDPESVEGSATDAGCEE
ncbi:MAG TPA: CBS domain-containing protein [Anaerolineales bacterium]|nr:CBS domain-containing protein [Anaerolineales bacterium]